MSLYSSSFLILNDGTVKSCGSNNYGQLGIGDIIGKSVPTSIPDLLPSFLYKKDGNYYGKDINNLLVMSISNIYDNLKNFMMYQDKLLSSDISYLQHIKLIKYKKQPIIGLMNTII